jgi:hypothetical protein
MHQVKLKCGCGKVEGVAKNIQPSDGTRVVCYCKSCQKFATNLDKGDEVLDSVGGTDIYQLSPSQVEFTKGTEYIKGMRHSDKGPHRWYASCCNTLIGNTAGINLPFVGLIHTIFADHNQAIQALGPVKTRVYTDGANGPLPPADSKLMPQWAYIIKFLFKLLGWKLSGKGRPAPFYEDDGKRKYPLKTWE